ncbi:MAG TPA: hypothetical protein VGV89_07300 [Thermoplasmata archaeon]|nr:hypothetical protein [Thermoplasmata archaeon]
MTQEEMPRPAGLVEYTAAVDVVAPEGMPGLSSAELTIWAPSDDAATDQLDELCRAIETTGTGQLEIGHTSWEYG